MSRRVLAAAWLLCVAAATRCDAQDGELHAAAEAALARLVGIDGTQDPLNYPFIGLDADAHFVMMNAATDSLLSFGPFQPEERPGEFRVLSAPVITPDQVHVVVRFTDADEDGEVPAKETAYVVVTRQDGEWGVQVIIVTPDSASRENAMRNAQSTIERFFTAWNAADNAAIHKQINFPHVFLLPGGRAAVANKPDDLITDFEGMQERDGWARSEYHGYEVVHADGTKVIARLTFTRHHADGTVYRTVPVVWVITNQDGHWGLQMRLILPAVETR